MPTSLEAFSMVGCVVILGSLSPYGGAKNCRGVGDEKDSDRISTDYSLSGMW